MRSAPWLLSLSLMWFGWGASTTMLGIGALVIGSAWAAGLFANERTPPALLWFTVVTSLGWLPALLWEPRLVVMPLALVGAWAWWRHRDRRRIPALMREFEEQRAGRE